MEQESYLKRIVDFYLKPSWTSLLTTVYLIFFGYFVIYFAHNILLALKYLWFVIKNSQAMFGLDYLFWGVAFILALVVPFSVSLYALAIPYEVFEKTWRLDKKILAISILILLVVLTVILMDSLLSYTASHEPMLQFVRDNGLNIKLMFYK
ncbi:MAG: hypothetical protein WCO30_01160 [bacterium]